MVKEFTAKAVATNEIYGVSADIFAPCALGASINDNTIPQLKVEIVAGAANNQLLEERARRSAREAEDPLRARFRGERRRRDQRVQRDRRLDPQRALRKADEIFATTLGVFEIAKADKIPTYRAADRLAEKRLKAVGALVRTWPQWPNK